MNLDAPLDIIALSVQIIGTFIVAVNSPKNLPNVALMSVSVDLASPQKRNNWNQKGLYILCVGFAIQLFSLVIKNF